MGVPRARPPGPPTTRTPTATPTRSSRRPSRPPARPTSASTGSPRAATRRSPPTSTGSTTATASPTSSSRSQEVAEHVYEVENEKLGWRDPRSDGTARAAPAARPTSTWPRSAAASSATPPPTGARPTKNHRLPRRLHGYLVLDNDYDPFEFPGTKPIEDLAGHLRPRVQPHPPVRLRRLPGRLVRRVDRDLDGGPGLQRDQRLPALRAALGEALRHADHGERDPRVRLGGLEPLADPPLRPLDHPQGLGRGDPRQARRLLGRRLRPRDPRRRAAPTSTTTSPASPATSPSGAPSDVFREGSLYLDVPRQGSAGADGAPSVSDRSTTPPSSCSGSTPTAAGRSSSNWQRPAGAAAGIALVGRIGSEERWRGRLAAALQAQRRHDCRCGCRPGPLRPDHRGR